METDQFDRVTRLVASAFSRRGLAGAFGLGVLTLPHLVDAKKKRRKRKNKKKIKRNDFGCVNAGGFCQNKRQCCSGICKGKKGRKKCKAHDTGGCTGEQDVCEGELVPCVATTGVSGACVRTTGNAGYCNGGGECFPCTKDVDCEAVCGPHAACIVCESECGPNGTACVGPSLDSCEFPE